MLLDRLICFKYSLFYVVILVAATTLYLFFPPFCSAPWAEERAKQEGVSVEEPAMALIPSNKDKRSDVKSKFTDTKEMAVIPGAETEVVIKQEVVNEVDMAVIPSE